MKSWARPSARRWSGLGTLALVLAVATLVIPAGSLARSAAPTTTTAVGTGAPHAANGTACAVGSEPTYDAYDPVTHDIYVPNMGSGNLSILNAACSVAATVTGFPTGAEPYAAAFNPTNNWVYVTDGGYLDRVYVISGTTLTTTITNASFDKPLGIGYDPGDAEMAVANYNGDSVTFISGTTVVGTTTVGTQPESFAFDPVHARLLVTDFGSLNVTSLNAQHPTDERDNINIPVGNGPMGVAFDIATSEDYVANFETDNVSVISGTGTQYGSISVGSGPAGVVWDQAKLSIDVANSGSGTVSVLEGLRVAETISGPSSSTQFLGIAYDETTDQIFVTDSGSTSVYIYGNPVASAGPVKSGTNCSAGNAPLQDAYDPVNHDIYVPNENYDQVYVLNGACVAVATISLSSGGHPTGVAFDPANNRVYVTSFTGGNLVTVIAGTTVVKTITSASFDAPYGIAYDPGDAVMAVSNQLSDNMTFISGYKVVGVVNLGGVQGSAAYDPIADRFLVSVGNNVTSMSALDPLDQTKYVNISLNGAGAIAFDVATSHDYVGQSNATMVVISGLGRTFGWVPVGSDPWGAVWDQAKMSVYVSSYGSSTITVIQGLSVVRTISAPSGSELIGETYDAATDQVGVIASSPQELYIYT